MKQWIMFAWWNEIKTLYTKNRQLGAASFGRIPLRRTSFWHHDARHYDAWQNDVQLNDAQHLGLVLETQRERHSVTMLLGWVLICWVSRFIIIYAEFHYAEYHILLSVILSIDMLSVIIAECFVLFIVILTVIMLSVVFYLLLCWSL